MSIYGESHIKFDLKGPEGINIDSESSVLDHAFGAQVPLAEVDWELDDYLDAVDTKQNDGNMFEMPNSFCTEEFSAKRMLARI